MGYILVSKGFLRQVKHFGRTADCQESFDESGPVGAVPLSGINDGFYVLMEQRFA